MQHPVNGYYLAVVEAIIDIGDLYEKHDLDPNELNVIYFEPMGYGDGVRINFRPSPFASDPEAHVELEIGCKGNRQPDPNDIHAIFWPEGQEGHEKGAELYHAHRGFFDDIFALVSGEYDEEG